MVKLGHTDAWDKVTELVTRRFDHVYSNKRNNKMEAAMEQVSTGNPQYSNIEEYKNATGKRFRMTKEQKARGLSREEAFEEFRNLPENCTLS